MNQQIVTAIYQNGVLRPLVSLDLPENSEVELNLKVIKNKTNPREAIEELLIKNGLSLRKKSTEPKQSLSADERERLAKIFSASQPLGELISEDREERF